MMIFHGMADNNKPARAAVASLGSIRIALFMFSVVFGLSVFGAPFHGEVFTYSQPDESTFQIRLYGDEFYAVSETLDGYVVIRDADTGFFCYATANATNTAFLSTGIRVGETPPISTLKKQRLDRRTIAAKSSVMREMFGVDQRGVLLPEMQQQLMPERTGLIDESTGAPPSSTTTGVRVGLVLLAQFPDQLGDATMSQSDVDAYCNDPNYTGYGNATSVYGYFYVQSNGNLSYNCLVTSYFTAANNRDYYTDNSIAYGTRAKELINEGLAVLKTSGFDFTKCDGNTNGVLDGVNCFYAGDRVNSWSQGLWPHKWSSSWAGLSGTGVGTSFQYQITNMGSSLSLGTFCHENGHMICDFPDLYSYSGNAANIGSYSLMHSSGSTHPVSVDAYLKVHAGWANVVDITAASHLRGAVQVDKNTFYRFRNPSESREYFLISIRTNSGYEGVYGGSGSTVNPTNGLVIWHALENGSNTYSSIFTANSPSASYTTPYELMVVEASPASSTTPWYDDPAPGSNDGFFGGGVSEASDNTAPALKFWNTTSGRTTASNLHIHSISAQGDQMTFTVGTGAVTGAAIIGTTTSALSPTCEYGVDATAETFSVFNIGAGTLSYSISDDVSWLTVSPTSGTATTESDAITVTYDTDALSAGTYNGTITITDGGATNSPLSIPITLTVAAQPTIGLNKSTITKSLTSGNSTTDTFTISNSGGGTLSYTLSEPANWLTLSANAGTVAAEEDEITVTINGSTLLTGSYTANITVSSTSATNSTQSVTVNLTVTGGSNVMVTSPDGGETLIQSNKHEITWLTTADVAGNVKIDLYKSGILDSTIVASTDNDSTYMWSIPSGQAIGSDYKIRVSDVADSNVYDESNANVSVAALPTLVSIPYSESFETSLGNWTQDATDDMDWTRDAAGTPSSGTGPSTGQDGSYYIYTEASNPNNPTKVAKLNCWLDLRSATAPLFSAYYHMYGSSMGSLVIRASSDQQNWTTILSQSGNLGNSWTQTNADLTSFAGFVVMIEIVGTTGTSWSSDMALDLITITEATRVLSYDTDTFTEHSANDGSIGNPVVITLSGDTFTSTAVSGGHIAAANVPTGLTAAFVRDSSTQITASLTGNASAHGNTNDINNLTINIADAALTTGNASTVAGNGESFNVDFSQGNGFTIDNPSVTEGNSGTSTLQFTVTLSPAYGSVVTVDYTTSNGSATAGTDYTATSGTLTFGATDTAKIISVLINADQIDENNETITMTLSNPSAGLAISNSTGTGTITDDDTAGITVSSSSGNTTEAGGTATFTVVLDSSPTASVSIGLSSNATTEGTPSPSTLSFTAANWNSPQTVTVTGTNDDKDDGDVGYSIITAAATSADSNYNGQNPNDVSVVNTDNDTAGITVSAITGNTTELGGTATFTVVLDTLPTTSVLIGLSSSDTTEGTVSPPNLTFTTGNWNSPQTVTVTGVDDSLADGSVAYAISTAPASSGDSNYNAMNAADVSVSNTDNESTGITISAPSGNTTENGGTATISAVLNTQPTDDVTVPFYSDDDTEGVLSASALTFTNANWDTPQTITVTGADDYLDDGDITYYIIFASTISSDAGYSGLDPSDSTMINTDNDTSGVTVSAITGNVHELGTTATFTLVLNTIPAADVTIALSSSDSTEGAVSPASLTFTSANWNTPQMGTVTGIDDDVDDGDTSFSIVTATAISNDTNYNGINPDDPTLSNIDDDTAGASVSAMSGRTSENGSAATFTIVLQTKPSADVNLGISSSDTTEGTVSPSSVTFTTANWNSPQPVTVTGIDDADADGYVSYQIITAPASSSDTNYNGYNPQDVAVINIDNDTTPVYITAEETTLAVAEGSTTACSIKLDSQPLSSVVISSSISGDSDLSISLTTLTFTAANWGSYQTITIGAAEDSDAANGTATLTFTSTSAEPATVSVTETDNDITTPGGNDDDSGGGWLGCGMTGGNPSAWSPVLAMIACLLYHQRKRRR